VTATEIEPGQHRALLYGDAGALVGALEPFVRDGLDRGESVLVALGAEQLGWVREALGDAADAIEAVDAAEMYARHGPMLSSLLQRFVVEGTPGEGRIRVVAEQSLTAATPVRTRAYLRYEAAANVAYRPFAASVLCPYDTARLPDEVLAHALETHPEVLEATTTRASPRFTDPREFIRRHSRVERPPADADELAFEDLADVQHVRHRVSLLADAAGLARAQVDELNVAVTEVVTNALRHGGPPRRLWAYTSDDAFVCQVQDGGGGLTDPLAGYIVPDLAGTSGRGLWLAHQLCDVVEAATDEAGTHVCVRMHLPR
jgi:anti-sigma regulatory factor (Ser/Thr protein kinase)